MSRLDDGIVYGQALLSPNDGKFKDQDGIFRRQGNQGNETDLEIDVILNSPDPD